MSTKLPPIGGAPVVLLPVRIPSCNADVTRAAAFRLPFPAYLAGVSTTARASTGTTPTLAANVKVGGTTVLSAPVAVLADSFTEATIATTKLADEAELTIDLDVGGTTPAFSDIDILITLVRV